MIYRLALFCLFFITFLYSQATAVIEETGQKVVLFENGTWQYVTEGQTFKQVFGEWQKSIKENQIEKYNMYCTKGFIESHVDNAERFFRQAVRKKFELKISHQRQKNSRVVLDVEIYRNNRRVDKVYLYLVQNNKSWLIDGLSENKQITNLFLEGNIFGHFHPENLPSLPELDELGKNLAHLHEKKKELNVTGDFVGEFSQKKYSFKNAHYSSTFGKGVLKFEFKSGDKGGREQAYFFVKRGKDNWGIYRKSSWISIDDFFDDAKH
ncbi:hypothetical protein [Candidatus Uabimicrobium sp. HlEnr_7]|uniref:hypothetical protein n=1 Tax=Candidatus Uabimicrobium helgolandensis TaxID=3095367 RepID=UPI0035572796